MNAMSFDVMIPFRQALEEISRDNLGLAMLEERLDFLRQETGKFVRTWTGCRTRSLSTAAALRCSPAARTTTATCTRWTAARMSVRCRPPTVANRADLAVALKAATPDEHGWIRGAGYTESVVGDLDAVTLDLLRAVRRSRHNHPCDANREHRHDRSVRPPATQ
jgi:hypothetical protein